MVERSRKKNYLVGFVIFALVFLAAFFGIQFFTKTGIFRIPGVVYYDDSIVAVEREILENIFTEEIDLDKDVRISAENFTARPELEEGMFLYSITVPVTDFYDVRTDTNEFNEEVEYILIDELDFKKKLLAVDGKYFLDDFNGGARYRVIKFESDKYNEEIKPLVEEALTKTFPEESSVLTMAQTGVTALSRGMNAKLNTVGGDGKFFTENIAEYLSSFDLTHTSNESSFTDYATNDNICSRKGFKDTLLAIGLDIVELTGNHNIDCGDVAAEETIDFYNENNIKIVGGGKTADEAAKPLEISQKNNNITFLAYNLSTGGATYDNSPGANQYYEESAAKDIATAKERGDIVIVDIQYYECSAYASEYEDATCDYANSAAGDQVGFFRHLIELGADIVVGTSAHQPQTFELYEDGVIYYGLGNLFFDQYWWPGTTRSLVLEHYFYEDKLLQTRVTPTVYDSNMQTKLLDEETSRWFLERLINARP